MQGTIKTLGKPGETTPTYGFIRGDDKIDRFFMPGVMTQPPTREFLDLRVGDRMEFEHQDHARGPRAVKVSFVCSSSDAYAA